MAEDQTPVTPAPPTPPPQPLPPVQPMPPMQGMPPMQPLPYVQPMPGTMKPGQLSAIAILDLIDGILNCIIGFAWLFGIVTIPIGAYAIAVGVVEIIYASKIMPDPIRTATPARYVAVMQIVNIISGNAISLVAGILSLVFYNDPRVIQYFNSRRGQVY